MGFLHFNKHKTYREILMRYLMRLSGTADVNIMVKWIFRMEYFMEIIVKFHLENVSVCVLCYGFCRYSWTFFIIQQLQNFHNRFLSIFQKKKEKMHSN